jgi:hypothetical protein
MNPGKLWNCPKCDLLYRVLVAGLQPPCLKCGGPTVQHLETPVGPRAAVTVITPEELRQIARDASKQLLDMLHKAERLGGPPFTHQMAHALMLFAFEKMTGVPPEEVITMARQVMQDL